MLIVACLLVTRVMNRLKETSPRDTAPQRVRHGPVVDQVRVPLAGRRATRIEARRRLGDAHEADRRRQRGVQRALDRGGVERGGDRERRGLPQGVDAGVGPAGADDARVGVEKSPGRLEDGTLDGRRIRLHLPAVEVGAVVRQHQLEGPAGRYRAGGRRRDARVGTNVSHTTATRRKRVMPTRVSQSRPPRVLS